jgi:hypothetical protein
LLLVRIVRGVCAALVDWHYLCGTCETRIRLAIPRGRNNLKNAHAPLLINDSSCVVMENADLSKEVWPHTCIVMHDLIPHDKKYTLCSSSFITPNKLIDRLEAGLFESKIRIRYLIRSKYHNTE